MRMRHLCKPAALAIVAMVVSGSLRPALAAPKQPPAPVISDLTPWLEQGGKPGPTAWQHAAHFSIAYEIDPAHNTPAPVSTEVDAGYTADALWLRFRAY